VLGRTNTQEDSSSYLLKEMAAAGLSAQQIYDGGRFPERTVEAINKQLERCRFVVARQKAFVETIEPSEDALSMIFQAACLSFLLA